MRLEQVQAGKNWTESEVTRLRCLGIKAARRLGEVEVASYLKDTLCREIGLGPETTERVIASAFCKCGRCEDS